jgi:hypothetical protein
MWAILLENKTDGAIRRKNQEVKNLVTQSLFLKVIF